MINRENYEIWFIDYLDGKLSPAALEEFRAFLLLHPDLSDELDLIKQMPHSFPQQSNDIFPDKSSLKKSAIPDQPSLDELLAMEMEGDLTPELQKQLNALLNDSPNADKTRAAMRQTKLNAGSETFDFKSDLKFNESQVEHNEDWQIIAVLEGDADLPTKQAIEAKLAVDADFRLRYQLLASTRLAPASDKYGAQNSLQFDQTPDFTSQEILLTALAEGDLQGDLLHQAEKLVAKNESAAATLVQLRNARLSATQIVAFPDKHTLRRKEAVVIPLGKYFAYMAGAAAVVSAILWFSFYKTGAEAGLASTQERNIHLPIQIFSGDQHDASPADSNAVPSNQQHPSGNRDQIVIPKATTYPEDNLTAEHRTDVLPLSGKNPVLLSGHHSTQLATASADGSTAFAAAKKATPVQPKEETTLLAYVGKKATDKLESTALYSFAERNIPAISVDQRKGKISPQELSPVWLPADDKFRLKIGNFEVESNRKNRSAQKDGRRGLIDRALDAYDRIADKRSSGN